MFLEALVPAAALVAGAAAAGRQQSTQQPPGRPPIFPPEDLPKVDKKAALKDSEKQIQQDVHRLYTLASELKDEVSKDEVSKTDSTSVLSLALVRRAEEIEKLAKQIKNLARG